MFLQLFGIGLHRINLKIISTIKDLKLSTYYQ